jgi:hypothetical protein
MTYKSLSLILKGLQAEEPKAFEMMCVAEAVKSNINLNDEDFEEICERVNNFYCEHDCKVDIDDFCYCIQEAIENDLDPKIDGFVNEYTMSVAWEMAVDMTAQRLG